MYKFEVTDSQNNTTVETYVVTDITRQEASITYKIVDANAFDKAKITFRSQEDVLLSSIPDGFEIDNSSMYGRDFDVYIKNEMQAINNDFKFVNNTGTETTVHVEGNVETTYRNIRNVSEVLGGSNVVGLKSIYGENGVTFDRAKNLVLRMKNAKLTTNNSIKPYYGTDLTEINMKVSSSKDISAAKILGGASKIQIKNNSNQVVDLEKGNAEIITSAERGQTYSSNKIKTGVYFKEELLVDEEGAKGNSFHVTIINK